MKRYSLETKQVDYLSETNREIHSKERYRPTNLFSYVLTDNKQNEIMSGVISLDPASVKFFFTNLLLSLSTAFCATITYHGSVVCDIYRNKKDKDTAVFISLTEDLKYRYPSQYEELPF